MPTFNPVDLSSWTGGRWTATPVSPLTGFAIDSRALRSGQVFVAIKTEKRDGHDFLAAADASGAGAAIVSTPNPTLALPQLVVTDPLAAFQAIAREHRRAFRGWVVGISGSAGKTSTKELLTLVLGGKGSGVPTTEGNLDCASVGAGNGVLATQGNLNNHLGVPLTLTQLDSAAHRFAVVEAGISAPGEMTPLAEMIRPDIAIITNVGPAHTLALGGLDGVAQEKSKLVRGMTATGVAVFPKSCTQHAAFRDLFIDQLVLERSTVLRPATLPQHTIHYNVIQRRDETVIAVAYGPPPPAMFKLRRVTDGMADNAAIAILVALRLGVDREAIQSRLARWTAPALRGEIRHEDGRLLYLDCYNANPASMADALATFTAITDPGERRLYAIGCMEELGAESPAHHRRLGRSLPMRDGDLLFVIGTQANEVCAGVLEQGHFTRQIQICSNLDPIAAAIADWRGAVFMKGSRRYQLELALAGSEAVHA